MIVQQDWTGKASRFHLTPIKSSDGKITRDLMSKMEQRKFYNNIKGRACQFKSRKDGGYSFE